MCGVAGSTRNQRQRQALPVAIVGIETNSGERSRSKEGRREHIRRRKQLERGLQVEPTKASKLINRVVGSVVAFGILAPFPAGLSVDLTLFTVDSSAVLTQLCSVDSHRE